MKPPENVKVKNDEQDDEEHQDDIKSPRVMLEIEYPTDSKGKPLYQQTAYGKLINADKSLQRNITLEKRKIVRKIYNTRRSYYWVML